MATWPKGCAPSVRLPAKSSGGRNVSAGADRVPAEDVEHPQIRGGYCPHPARRDGAERVSGREHPVAQVEPVIEARGVDRIVELQARHVRAVEAEIGREAVGAAGEIALASRGEAEQVQRLPPPLNAEAREAAEAAFGKLVLERADRIGEAQGGVVVQLDAEIDPVGLRRQAQHRRIGGRQDEPNALRRIGRQVGHRKPIIGRGRVGLQGGGELRVADPRHGEFVMRREVGGQRLKVEDHIDRDRIGELALQEVLCGKHLAAERRVDADAIAVDEDQPAACERYAFTGERHDP